MGRVDGNSQFPNGQQVADRTVWGVVIGGARCPGNCQFPNERILKKYCFGCWLEGWLWAGVAGLRVCYLKSITMEQSYPRIWGLELQGARCAGNWQLPGHLRGLGGAGSDVRVGSGTVSTPSRWHGHWELPGHLRSEASRSQIAG